MGVTLSGSLAHARALSTFSIYRNQMNGHKPDDVDTIPVI